MSKDVSLYIKVFGISEHHIVEVETGRGLRVCDSASSAWEDFTKEDVPLQDIESLKQKGYYLIQLSENDFRELFVNRYETLNNSGISVLVA